jgi:pimeloyl-ACP methyl ester carboxylesterase
MVCQRPRPAKSSASGCVIHDADPISFTAGFLRLDSGCFCRSVTSVCICVHLWFHLALRQLHTERRCSDSRFGNARIRVGNQPAMTHAEIFLDGRRLETALWGPDPAQCPTIVLLHEGLGCVDLWRDVPERLAAETGNGVFAYSRFGYGRSDPAPLPRPMIYMHDEALQVLPRVLDAAGITRAILVGHSDGGSIAAIYAGAVRDPRIVGVALIAAHFFVEDLNIESIARIRTGYETKDLRSRLARYHTDVDVAFRGWNDAWLDPRFREFDITEYLPTIPVPVLALQGADDPYGTEAQLHVLRRHVTSPLETKLIPGARHAPHLEAKETTIPIIASFAQRQLMEHRP